MPDNPLLLKTCLPPALKKVAGKSDAASPSPPEALTYACLDNGLLHSLIPPKMLAGTDAPEPYCPPGFALHQELELLVEAGLTPAAALQSATINNSRALRQEKHLGSIEPGKFADLVILGADPTADIRNTRKIVSVVHSGLVCDPQTLRKAVPVR